MIRKYVHIGGLEFRRGHCYGKKMKHPFYILDECDCIAYKKDLIAENNFTDVTSYLSFEIYFIVLYMNQ